MAGRFGSSRGGANRKNISIDFARSLRNLFDSIGLHDVDGCGPTVLPTQLGSVRGLLRRLRLVPPALPGPAHQAIQERVLHQRGTAVCALDEAKPEFPLSLSLLGNWVLWSSSRRSPLAAGSDDLRQYALRRRAPHFTRDGVRQEGRCRAHCVADEDSGSGKAPSSGRFSPVSSGSKVRVGSHHERADDSGSLEVPMNHMRVRCSISVKGVHDLVQQVSGSVGMSRRVGSCPPSVLRPQKRRTWRLHSGRSPMFSGLSTLLPPRPCTPSED